MTISPEAKEAATLEQKEYFRATTEVAYMPEGEGYHIQLAINSATAPLQKEIERLRGEIRKSYTEGYKSYHDPNFRWDTSRAKRVVEGKE